MTSVWSVPVLHAEETAPPLLMREEATQEDVHASLFANDDDDDDGGDDAPLLPPCLQPNVEPQLPMANADDAPDSSTYPHNLSPVPPAPAMQPGSSITGDDPRIDKPVKWDVQEKACTLTAVDSHMALDTLVNFAVSTTTHSDNAEKNRRSKRKPVPVRSRSPSDMSPPSEKKTRPSRLRRSTSKVDLKHQIQQVCDEIQKHAGTMAYDTLELPVSNNHNDIDSPKPSLSAQVSESATAATAAVPIAATTALAQQNDVSSTSSAKPKPRNRNRTKRKAGGGDAALVDYGAYMRVSLAGRGIDAQNMRNIIRSSVLTPSELCAVRNFERVSSDAAAVSPCWQQVVNSMILRVPPPLNDGAVSGWDVSKVVEFVALVISDDQVLHKLIDDEIDGEALLLLSLDDLTNRLKLKLGPALKLYHTILAVKHTIK